METILDEAPGGRTSASEEILHWYDFVCPFCYLSQPDNDELVEQGWRVFEMGFSAHPEIPAGGIHVGPRSGAMYASIDQTAARLGLPLNWPDRLPSTRLSLGAAEWIRLKFGEAADAFRKAMFAAHFAERRDIGDVDVVLAIAERCDVPVARLSAGIESGEADKLLQKSQSLGVQHGVSGTPAWFVRGRLLVGLQQGGLARRLGAFG